MLRRKPTRLELKLDDIEEFEGARKELEARRRPREEAAGGEDAAGPEPRSREQAVNERIGYKPQPKAGGRPAPFSSLEF